MAQNHNSQTISTIIFDLSDVLIKGLEGSENLLKKHYKNIHINHFFIKPISDFFSAKISEEEYFKAFNEYNKLNISINILKKAVRDNFTEIEGTREIIKKLKTKNYKLGLLSIHTKEWIEYCERKYKYHHLFNTISYSYHGVSKPNKESFELVLKQLEAQPNETLFIDDNEKNISAANNLGLNTIKFVNPKQLRGELREYGIQV